ncbi:phosphate/phosphite/phosphonate ABC transporter substrate-binding protein [Granulicoccus phenolivorans]|uniref:phosphate/phosphite/phosphonate ABC transporter substrate-binding protein n=1 Tax=Granulicoccus phenolivorans TaxID=266854 RepID=UPI0004284863|nr:phosphate/phosphite/phosphonate ABC transporter substrate-binding protein [Granulicoccus phenolivorans]
MFSRSSLAAVAAVGATALLLSACGSSAQSAPTSSAKDTIVFAAVPSEQSSSLRSQYENVIKVLEKDTGKKVEFQDATNYAAVIEGQRAGKIDIAGYGPFSYKIAKDGGVPIEPVSSAVKNPGDTPGYHSTAWVPADSTITDLSGFRGKKVCFVDAASTSGFLFPSAGLLEVGIDPNKDVTQVLAGKHDASMLSTASGQCDAGFAQDSMVPDLIKKGQLKEGQLKQVWESPLIPGSPIAMNTTTLDADTQAKVRTALQEHANVKWMVSNGICTDEASCKMPEDKPYSVKVDDKFYDPIRQVCDATHAKACNAA